MSRESLVDQLSRFVCDPRAGDAVALTLDRDDAWETLGALAYGGSGVVLRGEHLDLIIEVLTTHAQTLLVPRPQPLDEAQARVAQARAASNLAAWLRRVNPASLYRLTPAIL